MTIYHNLNQNAALRAVEFAPSGEGQLCFFHLNKEADEHIRQLLADTGQEAVAQAEMGDRIMLVTRDRKTPQEILTALAMQGGTFAEIRPRRKLSLWALRGSASMVGQTLQLVSSIKSSSSLGDRAALAGAAVSNLLANIINIAFGTQRKDDPHQLRVLKEQFNSEFAHYLSDGATLPSPDERQVDPRTADASLIDRAKALVSRYSVSGGEVGLRFLGALSLAFPLTRWRNGWTMLARGESLRNAFNAMRNENPYSYRSGILSLWGKALALCSKEPDPYNPKPFTWVDFVREKVTFRLSSVLEAAGHVGMSYDRFKNQRMSIGGKSYRDFFGGAGNAVFVMGYIPRLFVRYGVREVDMKELYAHIASGLAKIPPEQRSRLLLENALALKRHFQEKIP